MTVERGYRFAAIPEWVLYEPGLTGDDIRLFGILDRYGRDVRPAIGTLAAQLRKSEDSVRRSLRRLEEVGALWIEERFVEGRQLSHRYHLAGDAPVQPRPRTDATPGGSTDATPPLAPVLPEREQMNESKKNENPPAPPTGGDDAPDGFHEFWEMYPRKEGKRAAARAFKAATKRASVDDILSGLAERLQFWTVNKTERRYIKTPAAWLNGDHWTDEVVIEDAPKSKREQTRSVIERMARGEIA